MKPGVTAVITSTDQPNLRLEGKVARTAKAINPASRTIRVEIDVPNTDRSLVPGMYVQADFELTGGAAIQVPAAALLYRSGGPQVAVIDPNGTVSFRDVTIASDDGNVVSIGSGLADRRQGRAQSQQPDRRRRKGQTEFGRSQKARRPRNHSEADSRNTAVPSAYRCCSRSLSQD